MGARPRNSTPKRPDASGIGPPATSEHAQAIAALLAVAWPDAVVELDHRNAYELLVATILAAQSTDKMINTITPALFARYPDATSLAGADQAELEPLIFRSGFYRAKARNLLGMARMVVAKHGGEVPDTMEALVELPGVARKTANVVLGSALGKHVGVVVDTHVTRLAGRLGLTRHTDPVKIERDLMELLPRDQWTMFAHRLIWHGRRVCFAPKPACESCLLAPRCPSAGLGAAAPGPRPEKPARPKPTKPTKPTATATGAKKRAAAKPGPRRGAAR